MNEIVTENWSDFGYREKKMALELLNAWMEQKYARNELHMGNNIRAAMNRNSGYVFLTNDEYDAFMLNGESELDIYLNCPECGNEGFPSTLADDPRCDKCLGFAWDFLSDGEKDDWQEKRREAIPSCETCAEDGGCSVERGGIDCVYEERKEDDE